MRRSDRTPTLRGSFFFKWGRLLFLDMKVRGEMELFMVI
jgi:hypothetical protein